MVSRAHQQKCGVKDRAISFRLTKQDLKNIAKATAKLAPLPLGSISSKQRSIRYGKQRYTPKPFHKDTI